MKQKFLEEWKKFHPLQKLCYCLGILSAIGLAAMAVLLVTGAGEVSVSVFLAVLALIELCMAGVDWFRQRGIAIVSMGISVVLLFVSLLIGS